MTITILTLLFDYALDVVLVGAAVAAISRKLKLSPSPRRDLGVLFALFAFLDLLWIPAVSELGMSITFENPAVYAFFGIEGPVRGEELFGAVPLDVVFWFIQALLARVVAVRIGRDDWLTGRGDS